MDILKQNSTTRDDLGMRGAMDALAEEEQVTQRELARRTGLNLKKSMIEFDSVSETVYYRS